jgi:DNA invertase Pin-like site-specific DNA recombinase
MNIEQQFQAFAKGYDKKIATNKDVFIYTRVSSKDQEQNKSLATQLDRAKTFARENGYNIIEIFGGTYESASGDYTRKEFDKLLIKIRSLKRKPHGILLNTINRFSRAGGGGVALAFDLVEKLGVHLIDVTTKNSTETEQGRLHIYQELLKAKQENIDRLKHTVPGMERHIREGKWLGNAPKGYDQFGPKVKDMKFYSPEQRIVLNDEGKLLKKAWHWKLQGERDFMILQRLEDLGLKLTKQMLSSIWRNPFYCGVSNHRMLDGVVTQGRWEKMVSEQDFLMVQEILKGNNFGYKHEKANPNRPLTAFITCSCCGNKLTGYEVKKKRVHYYKCQGCKGGSINALTTPKAKAIGANDLFVEHLQQFELSDAFIEVFKEQMKLTYDLLSGEAKEDNALFQKELDKWESQLKTVKKNFAMGMIDDKEVYQELKAEFEGKILELKQKMGDASNELSNLDKYIIQSVEIAKNLSKYWVSSGIDMKKRLQELVFPQGLVLDMKNRQYLTSEVNSIFEFSSRISGLAKGGKENGSRKNLEPSYPVERRPSISNQRLTNDLLQVSRFHYFLKSEGILQSHGD